MSTLEQRFKLVDELDSTSIELGSREPNARKMLTRASDFLWNMCACRSCGAHVHTFTVKLSCQFCTVCGQHRNSPEVEA